MRRRRRARRPGHRSGDGAGRHHRRRRPLRRFLYFSYRRFGRALSGAYKVVRCSRFSSWRRHDHRLLEITTAIAAQPAAFTCSCHGCTAAVNGVLHFLTGHPFAPTCRSHVACFDLESEEWKTTIEAPATEWPKEEERWEITIGELKGTLSMVETVRSLMDGTAYTNIWLLVDSEKSVWVKEYTIHMPRTVSLVEALEVLGDGTILLLSTFEMEGNSHLFERKKMRVLQLYGPSTRVCKDLMKMAEHRFCNKIALYTGSLLS
ncbi:hypothetical protein SETIT_4G190100v2 [Setaria italica]|uniref:F-box associated beta-propeller type 3 domain-containing protein n=1 Tax=Setaria italica TaxID=4555 RepID=A0A368QW65_SETIT|nr:hypothetical protein SETIT_4G190100v2 [Setaria italica]